MKGRDSARGESSQAIGSIRTQNWGHKNTVCNLYKFNPVLQAHVCTMEEMQ